MRNNLAPKEIFIPPMNPLEGLSVPRGLLEVCQNWQKVVDHMKTPEEKTDAAVAGVAEARKMDGFYGTDEVIVKSELGLIIDDGDEGEDLLCAARVRGFTARGLLRDVVYFKVIDYTSIAWQLSEARVLAADQNEEVIPDGTEEPVHEEPLLTPTGRIRKPIYLPVGFIDCAVCAA